MVIGDYQWHAAKPTAQQFPEKIGPERFHFAAVDFKSLHLASALVVDARRQSSDQQDDATAFPNLDVSDIQSQQRPLAFERPVQERSHASIEFLTPKGNFAALDAAQAHGLHQAIDLTRRSPRHEGLLNDRSQRSFREPERGQKGGKVSAVAQFRNRQLHFTGPGLPSPSSIAAAPSGAVGIIFA